MIGSGWLPSSEGESADGGRWSLHRVCRATSIRQSENGESLQRSIQSDPVALVAVPGQATTGSPNGPPEASDSGRGLDRFGREVVDVQTNLVEIARPTDELIEHATTGKNTPKARNRKPVQDYAWKARTKLSKRVLYRLRHPSGRGDSRPYPYHLARGTDHALNFALTYSDCNHLTDGRTPEEWLNDIERGPL